MKLCTLKKRSLRWNNLDEGGSERTEAYATPVVTAGEYMVTELERQFKFRLSLLTVTPTGGITLMAVGES